MCDDEETCKDVEMKEELEMDLAQIHGRLGDLSRHDGHYKCAINDYELCCEKKSNILADTKSAMEEYLKLMVMHSKQAAENDNPM